MTSPERLRRRQRIEGVFLICLGAFIAAQSIYFNQKDSDQQDCLETNFVNLSVALNVRADLAQDETAVRKRVDKAESEIWDTYARAAGLLRDDPTAELPPAKQEQLQIDLVDALLNYQAVSEQAEDAIVKIQLDRTRNPVPPYPVGTCSDASE